MSIYFPSHSGTGSSASRFVTSLPWQGGASAFEASPASLLDAHPGRPRVLTMQVAGSGRADLVQIWSSPGGELHATTYLATVEGAGIAYRRAADQLLGSFGVQVEVLQGDLDGDGRDDLIVAYAGGPGRELRLATFLGNGSGFTAAGDFATGAVFSPRHLAFFVLDTTGDGRADVVEAYERIDPLRGGLLTFRTFRSYFGGRRTFGEALVGKTSSPSHPAGEALGFWPLGAGAAASLVRVCRRACDDHVIAESYLAGTAPEPFAAAVASDLGAFPRANQQAFFPADVDGNGIPDLVQAYTEISGSGVRLHLKTFFGGRGGRFAAGPESVFEDPAASPFHLLDAGPGGSPTLVRRFIGGAGRQMFASYRASPGGLFKQAGPFDAGPGGPGVASADFLVGDVDGDGKDELLRLRLNALGQIEVLPYRFDVFSSRERFAPPVPGRRILYGRMGAESAAGG